MWTYLLILLSVVVLIGVFVRKQSILRRLHLKKDVKNPEEEAEPEKAMKRGDASKISAICEKADVKMNVGNEKEAVRLLVQALAINEDHLEAQHKLAMLYMKKEMYGAASALFRRLSELDEDAVHFSHLGLALYQQQEFEGARNAYQRAVELDPSRPARFVSLGQVYRSLGQLQNSIVAINKALEMEDNENFRALLKEVEDETS